MIQLTEGKWPPWREFFNVAFGGIVGGWLAIALAIVLYLISRFFYEIDDMVPMPFFAFFFVPGFFFEVLVYVVLLVASLILLATPFVALWVYMEGQILRWRRIVKVTS